ncbi:hypothetical protein RYH80_17605 [Halobaculum sp. MBLA0147]|uniref:hypothetical protein n=1 Tax=Halobaculum sp. MBLA0147 TaxID=3079934 RepID=UPI0035251AF8
MLRDRAYATVSALARRPRLVVSLVLLVLLASQGAVAEGGDLTVSPLEEGRAILGSDGKGE